MRGWGLGTRLDHVVSKRSVTWELGLTQLYTDVLKHKQPVKLLKGTRSVTHCTGHVSANARMCWGDQESHRPVHSQAPPSFHHLQYRKQNTKPGDKDRSQAPPSFSSLQVISKARWGAGNEAKVCYLLQGKQSGDWPYLE